jgi:hypothetical protein
MSNTPTPTTEAQRQQVAAQYRAVAHLATAIAEIHSDQVESTEAGVHDRLATMRGPRSHRLMVDLAEWLDALGALGADGDKDDWLGPVFDTAESMFPLGVATHG